MLSGHKSVGEITLDGPSGIRVIPAGSGVRGLSALDLPQWSRLVSAIAEASRDLDFLLFDWLRVEDLLARPRFADHSRETLDAVLDLSEGLAADVFVPAYKPGKLVMTYTKDGCADDARPTKYKTVYRLVDGRFVKGAGE